jgi:hypothetical protein
MSKVCSKCNAVILEEHTAEIRIIDGYKVLVHSNCPQAETINSTLTGIGGGGSPGGYYQPHPQPAEESIKYKDVNFEIKIDQAGDYIICDEDESTDMDEKWDDAGFGNPEACQTYRFVLRIPIPRVIKTSTRVIPPEVMQDIIMTIKNI